MLNFGNFSKLLGAALVAGTLSVGSAAAATYNFVLASDSPTALNQQAASQFAVEVLDLSAGPARLPAQRFSGRCVQMRARMGPVLLSYCAQSLL